MRKEDIKVKYRTYGYRSNVPLISVKDQWMSYFDKKFDGIDVNVEIDTDGIIESIENAQNTVIESIDNSQNTIIEAIDNSQETLVGKFDEINENIEQAEQHLCCDICCAKNDIKKHIDDKFTSVNFEQKFSDLNEQVTEILNKLEQ